MLKRGCLWVVSMLALATLTGCNPQQKQNIQAVDQIAASIYVYENQDYDFTNGFPKTLNDLVTVRIMQSVPQCECDDGKRRDFIYISGFHHIPYGYVFLASPAEMNSEKTIVCFGGEEPKVLSRSEALKEIEKSRALVRELNGPVEK